MKEYKKRSKGNWQQGKAYKGQEGAERQFSNNEIAKQIKEIDPNHLERYHKGKRTRNVKARLEYRLAWYESLLSKSFAGGWIRKGYNEILNKLNKLKEKDAK